VLHDSYDKPRPCSLGGDTGQWLTAFHSYSLVVCSGVGAQHIDAMLFMGRGCMVASCPITIIIIIIVVVVVVVGFVSTYKDDQQTLQC